jgi:hypothetical protein
VTGPLAFVLTRSGILEAADGRWPAHPEASPWIRCARPAGPSPPLCHRRRPELGVRSNSTSDFPRDLVFQVRSHCPRWSPFRNAPAGVVMPGRTTMIDCLRASEHASCRSDRSSAARNTSARPRTAPSGTARWSRLSIPCPGMHLPLQDCV